MTYFGQFDAMDTKRSAARNPIAKPRLKAASALCVRLQKNSAHQLGMALSLAFLLSACTVMSHERIEGWPSLQVTEHYVPHAQMRDRCAKYVGFGMSPIACAEFYLNKGECHIWYSKDSLPPRFVIEHERQHCAGFDHIGSTNMRNLLARWRMQ